MPDAPVAKSRSRLAFEKNVEDDIQRLWEIHEEVAGPGRGRKHGVEVLNRAALVFISASWEAYVEDLAIEAHAILLPSGQLPSGTCTTAAAAQSRADTLHTPFSSKVVSLFRDVLGIQDVSTDWYWQNSDATKSASKLNEYVTDRCTVAHRLSGDDPTPKFAGTDFLSHVRSLVECTEWTVFHYAKSLLGSDPWS